jgi:hypothetical protein
MCWNTAATAVNMSFRYELFALGAWTDWFGNCYRLCLKGGGQACATVGSWGCCCCCVLLRSAAAKEIPVVVWLEENTLPVVVLGAICGFSSFVSVPWRTYSWRDEVPLRPPTCSCSMSLSNPHYPFPGTPCAGDHPHTTYNWNVACS